MTLHAYSIVCCQTATTGIISEHKVQTHKRTEGSLLCRLRWYDTATKRPQNTENNTGMWWGSQVSCETQTIKNSYFILKILRVHVCACKHSLQSAKRKSLRFDAKVLKKKKEIQGIEVSPLEHHSRSRRAERRWPRCAGSCRAPTGGWWKLREKRRQL